MSALSSLFSFFSSLGERGRQPDAGGGRGGRRGNGRGAAGAADGRGGRGSRPRQWEQPPSHRPWPSPAAGGLLLGLRCSLEESARYAVVLSQGDTAMTSARRDREMLPLVAHAVSVNQSL